MLLLKVLILYGSISFCQEPALSNPPPAYNRLYLVENLEFSGWISEGYHFVNFGVRSYLMSMITDHIHAGIYLGGYRSFATHNEKLLGHISGARTEFQVPLKGNFRFHAALEIQAKQYYIKKLPDFTRPDSIQPYNTISTEEYALPAVIGFHLQLNPHRNKHVDIFFSPEFTYNFPIGYRLIKQAPIELWGLNLLRFSFLFKK